MGIERERVELIAWLVEHHLMLSDYAQKRDVGDPATVASFAKIVGDPERLRLLLVLTVADIRAVGPGVWNGWKGQLMRELFGATEAVFRGGRTSDPAANFRRHQEAEAADSRGALAAIDPQSKAWAISMEDAYFTAWSRPEHQVHALLSRRAAETGGAAAQARIRPDRTAAEVTIAATDRRGLFADLAYVLSAMGANIVGARVYTSQTGQALDVFYIQDASGAPFGGDNRGALDRLIGNLEAAARGEMPSLEQRRAPDTSRSAAFSITPVVTLDNDASRDSTVIEVSGRDRPGLLNQLSRAIAEADLSIYSAHVENYGERAVDAFYVRTATGTKLTDAKARNALQTALAEVLAEEDQPVQKGRPRLQRAKASMAR
jgi:[protein-PII] uridylyltransferase